MILLIGHPGKGKTREAENRSVVAGAWRQREGCTTKGQERILGGDRMALYVDNRGNHMTVRLCQNTQKGTRKRVNFPVCKLYLNKPDQNIVFLCISKKTPRTRSFLKIYF